VHFFPLDWAAQPPHARLFVFYLLVVTCFAAVRSVQLARRLYSKEKSLSSSDDSQTLKLFATCDADIASIRRLVPLTLGISLLVVIGGGFSTWNDESANPHLNAIQSGYRALEELFARFSLGLFVSILLYAVASFFQAIVARRRIKSDFL
jgi:hypothetical protein